MTAHYNDPYECRFRQQDSRPSNQLPPGFFDAPTRARISELTAWLDGQAVVEGAEWYLRAAAVLGRRPRRGRLGDPGE